MEKRMKEKDAALRKEVQKAREVLKETVLHTPLQFSQRLSDLYGAKVYLKREDQQVVRSYKIRGAYYNIFNLDETVRSKGVVCASAGNHAQGFALSCKTLKIPGYVFMPQVTPRQKVNKVKSFGGKFVTIEMVGTTFDEASDAAKEFCKRKGLSFVHPFDNIHTIAGQGTVGAEILEDLPEVELIVVPVGGGGLISGLGSYVKQTRPGCKITGVDPAGAPKMKEALRSGHPIRLDTIDSFIDGAAVKQVGELTYKYASRYCDDILTVPEGKVCTTMIELYQNEGIIAEPAGAMSIAALEQLAVKIKGKNVVCIISGGNNDIARYPEVIERSLIYEGLKHYFIVDFAQKPGELRKVVDHVLGPNDDIVRFEYLKKTNKEFGPALIGIELTRKEDLLPLTQRFSKYDIRFRNVTNDQLLWNYLM